MLQFGEFLPDQSDYTNAGATDAKNCIPLTNKSYAPLRDLSAVIDALSNRIQGAASMQESDGTQHTFCGDNQNLFLLGSSAFAEISKSTNAYTCATNDHWDFVQYGNRVIAVNGHTDAPQSYVMGAINDPTDWPTIGSSDAAQKQSDRQDLPNGLSVQAITGAVGGADGAVFMRDSVYRVTYVGAPLVFEFQEVELSRGTIARQSVVNVGTFAFYLAEQGFFVFNGTSSQAIGNQKVDKFFFADLDFNFVHRITAAADPVNKLVYWSYPGANNTDGTPNKVIIYNWEINRWSYGEITADLIFTDTSPGYTMDNIDGFGNLDALATSLDDRFWVGGFSSLSAFNATHRLSTFTGSALATTLTTTEFGGMELFTKPNERMYVNGVRPYIDGGTVTVELEYRDSPSGSISTDGPNSVDGNGMAHFTRSCRYARATVNVAAGGTWTHAQGIDMDAAEDGTS